MLLLVINSFNSKKTLSYKPAAVRAVYATIL